MMISGCERIVVVVRRLLAMAIASCCIVVMVGCGSGVRVASGRIGIALVPDINAGWAGWCLVGAFEDVGCSQGRVGRYPIIEESWSDSSPPPMTTGLVLTAAKVMALRVNNEASVRTRREATIPYGIRAAAIEIRGYTPGPARPLPRLTPLDATGNVIRRSNRYSPPLGYQLRTRPAGGAGEKRAGVSMCDIEAKPMKGLIQGEGRVVTPVRPVEDLLGRAFLSCASISYTLQGWPMLAGVLMDAAHPGAAPASLPAIVPVRGHSGVFQALSSEGAILARRISGAWLVVAKGEAHGEGIQRRLLLLNHLQARAPTDASR